jgi:hypothetical protein
LKTRSGSSASATSSSYSFRQLNVLPADAHDARGEVDLEVPHGQTGMARTIGTAQDGPDPREELVVHERFAV